MKLGHNKGKKVTNQQEPRPMRMPTIVDKRYMTSMPLSPGNPGKAFNIVMLSDYHHSFKRKTRFLQKMVCSRCKIASENEKAGMSMGRASVGTAEGTHKRCGILHPL